MNKIETLDRIRERQKPWDIVVIGGGATGVGCGLDAATRGLDVLLLEQDDLGKSTSSRSTKLIHGGVRYLAQGNISLVREALHERGVLQRNAPDYVKTQAFLIPYFDLIDRLQYRAGLKLYDLLAGGLNIGKSRMVTRREAEALIPNLAPGELRGAVEYFDGQFDDARLLVALARTAAKHGASIATRVRVDGFMTEEGRVRGVSAIDVLTGERFEVRSRVVINAAGVFCDGLRSAATPGTKPLVRLSQGTHIVLDNEFLGGETALMIPKTNDGRVLFCIPWLGSVVVGTTDMPIDHADLEPAARASEIDFILETAGRYLAKRPERSDIRSVFTGIRPLFESGDESSTASLSREHFIEDTANGLITVVGGKWTTYRKMAEETVDRAVETYSLDAGACVTESTPVEPPIRSTPGAALLHPAFPYTTDDARNAVRHEMAVCVEDVLARRTRMLFLDARAAAECADIVSHVIAEESMIPDYDAVADAKAFKRLASRYLAQDR
jgi:glycerol-3-phosphate dehydrogenase